MCTAKKIIIAVTFLIVFILLIRFSGITDIFSVEQLKLHRVALQTYVSTNYTKAVVWYVCLYFLVAALAIPMASVFTLGGGFLFGTLAGTLYTNIGATVGATCIFLLVRYYLGVYVQARYQKQLKQFNEEFAANGTHYLLSVRLVSVVPFFIINVCAGLTNATLIQFMITTAIGILPGSLVYSYAGQQLMHINTLSDIITLPVVLAFGALALLSLLPVIIKKTYAFFIK